MSQDDDHFRDHMERLQASNAPMASLADLQAFLRALEDPPMTNIRTTTDGQLPTPGMEHAAAPKPINPETGQHGAYYILSAAERAKGFVRPVRTKYVHTGERPKHPLRELTAEEHEQYDDVGYVKFETYPAGETCTGRFWTAKQFQSGCGAVTSMRQDIAETYARQPAFYGSTFCCSCGKHLPVAEFTWDGTTEVVGS